MLRKRIEERRVRRVPISTLILIGVILAMIFLFMLTGARGASEPENNEPKIKDFEIVKVGDNYLMRFYFSDVGGGLEKAIFTIGYVYQKDETIIDSNAATGFTIVPKIFIIPYIDPNLEKKEFKTGKYQTIIPFFGIKYLRADLKSGDKIKYFIFLVDSLGRKSNIVVYEYIIREWAI